MKRAITIIILAIILISIGTVEIISVGKFVNKLDKDVDILIPIYEENKDDITMVFNKVQEMKDKWEEKEYNLSLIFNHKDLSMVNDSLCRLAAYTKNNDYDNAIAEIYILKEYSEKNRSIMGYNFQNIF